MRIITSTYTAVQQIDGRYSVTEIHEYDTGGKDTVIYIAPNNPDWDFQFVANTRAENVNRAIEQREQMELEANNNQAPITKRQFLALIPQAVRIQLRTAAATNAVLADALVYLDAGEEVFKSNATVWLNGLVQAGAMSSTIRDQILAAWTAQYG